MKVEKAKKSEKKEKEISEKINIPSGVDVNLDNSLVKVKGKLGELEKKFIYPKIKIFKENSSIVLSSEISSRDYKRILYSFKSHIQNMMTGVQDGFTYQLKVCSGHFPMSLKVEKDKVLISNFLGEKIPRISKILPDVNVKVEGDTVTVSGIDLENAGQTAANLEIVTRIKARDRRVFQDGIWITSKPQ